MDRILGVAIGIATVCLVLSIIASHLQELWASFAERRAASLERALQKMLDDPGLTATFFAHPLIQTIAFSRTRSAVLPPDAPPQPRPSYIPSDLFNKVLQSALINTHGLPASDLPTLIQSLPDSPLKTRLSTLTMGLQHDARRCNAAIEKWYDDTMDRINGLYKRNTQVILLALGFSLAVACNANLLHVANVLWTSSAARDELSAMAQVMEREGNAADNDATTDQGGVSTAPGGENPGARQPLSPRAARLAHQISMQTATANLESLPIGYGGGNAFLSYWQDVIHGPNLAARLGEWIYNLLGWLLTAVAVSLGAPFWFDLINKFINIRMVGHRPATASEEEQRSKTA
jgi:hypothetical protein